MPPRNTSTYTLPDLSPLFFLLMEDEDFLLQEDNSQIALELLPYNDVSLNTRNISSYVLPSRN